MVSRLGAVRSFGIMEKLQDKMEDRNAEKQGTIASEHMIPLRLSKELPPNVSR